MLRTRVWFSSPSSTVSCAATVFSRAIICGPSLLSVCRTESLPTMIGVRPSLPVSLGEPGVPEVMATFETPVTPWLTSEAVESSRTGVSSSTSTRTRTTPLSSSASCMSMTLPTLRPANVTSDETPIPDTSVK